MTDKELLIKIIEKAEKNGFNYVKWFVLNFWQPSNRPYSIDVLIHSHNYKVLIFDHEFAKAFFGEEEKYNGFIEIPYELSKTKQQRKKLIIKAEFIKLFGQDNYTNFVEYDSRCCLSHKLLSKNKILKCFEINTIEIYEKKIPCTGWQHHIQQMVLAKEPLKYLEKFLNKE